MQWFSSFLDCNVMIVITIMEEQTKQETETLSPSPSPCSSSITIFHATSDDDYNAFKDLQMQNVDWSVERYGNREFFKEQGL